METDKITEKMFKIENIEIAHIKIPFKERFTHSSKSRISSENIILTIKSKHNIGYGESIPREYVTGETPQTVIKTLQKKIIPHFKNNPIRSKTSLLKKIWKFRKTLDTNELSAFGAFEIAILHLAAKEIDLTIEDIFKFLKIKPEPQKEIQYSAIIGDKSLLLMILKAFIIRKRGFKQVKIKIDEKNLYKLKYLSKILDKQSIRIDSNSGLIYKNFEKTLIYLQKLKIKQIEQPFHTTLKSNTQAFKIAQKYDIDIILDESLCNLKDLEKLGKQGNILNIRPSKVGGILSSIYMYKYAKKHNFKAILACLVGETILTKTNQILTQQMNLFAREGNYDQFLFEKSIIDNKPFNKDGKYSNKSLKLSYSDKININIKKYIINKNLK
jgi:L-alanine-DL-glutamate epimerase-like enolase superfamily enzyme